VTATHVTVTELTARLESVEHKLYIGSFFSSPALFDDTETANCCGTLIPNRKGMPKNFGQKMTCT
jgi:hypothetical protein